MKALWQIILAILWRLRPVQALEANLAHIIQLCLGMFSDEDAIDDLTFDPAYSQTIAAAFFDAHRKVDLLIYLRACEIVGVRPIINSFKPDFRWTHSSTNLIALWRSFQRLAAKFADYERYAIKRAERLRREDTTLCPSLRASPLRLDATHRSTSPGFAGGGPTTHTALEVLPRQRRGRWRAHTCARDGGGCASSRGCLRSTGPPFLSQSPNPTAHPGSPASGIAPA